MLIPMILAIVAALLFGAATPLSKLLLGTIHPFMLAGLLYLGAALALAPKVLRGDLIGKLRALDRKNRLYILGSVIGGGMLGPVLLLFGLVAAKSASVSLWLNLELVATAVLGHFLFKDRMTRASAAATAGILGASILLSFEGGSTSVWGGLLVAAACVAWGFDNHFTALIDGLRPEESTFMKGIAAGTTNLFIGIFTTFGAAGAAATGAASGRIAPALSAIAAALAIGSLSYGASIVLYIQAAQGMGASRAQLFFSSSPLFGLALAALVLGESLSLSQLAAVAIMGASFALLASERHGHEHGHAAQSHTHWHRHDEGHHLHTHSGPSLFLSLFGHSHAHEHDGIKHEHPHSPDMHHRHGHG